MDLDITIDEFNALGFEYGDSYDVTFSNGYKLEDIPYYNGYYSKTGHPLISAYPGYPHIDVCVNNGDPLWGTAGLKEGDTGTVTLCEKASTLQHNRCLLQSIQLTAMTIPVMKPLQTSEL